MDGDNPRGHADLPDQPELYGARDTRERDAYALLLSREPWHWFATLTFRREHEKRSGGLHPEKADKAYRYWVRRINEHLYGLQWRKKPHGGVVWARGQEFHKDGKVHFHAVLAAPDRDLNSISRYDFHELWYRDFGRNQIERPVDQQDVVGYVSKYVTKDGEVDFSANFGKTHPPRLFEVEGYGGGPVMPQREASALLRLPDHERQPGPVGGKGGHSLTPPLRPQFLLLNRTHETETRHQLSTTET